MPDKEHLGPLLRKYRVAAGLTQEQLAERSGVSARTISDVEREVRPGVYRDTAGRLAEALGLNEEAREIFERAAREGAWRGPRRDEKVTTAGLPRPSTRLIGRHREVAVVSAALDDGVRLVTLTGPGGIGKTRIAIEAATAVWKRGRHSVFFVPLGEAGSASFVGSTVAATIGVTSPEAPTPEAIADHLGGEPTLLALDTFEHVIEAAGFVADLITRSTALQVLVTSRERLHLSGEHEVAIPSLELPMSAWERPAEEVLRNPATRLFVDRARAARSDFALDEERALVIRDICTRLEGLPLAIELAAARVRHLPLESLRARLDDRMAILRGGPRDLPARQRAMRDTIAWSYGLLSPQEQDLLRRLGVFAGSWTLQAAAWVAEASPEETLERMSALADKSLVSVADDVPGEARYRTYDVIRDFALEHLKDEGDLDTVRGRHAEFHLRLAEEAEPELGGAAQGDWIRRLEFEHPNLRAAVDWLIEVRDGDRALRLAGALWQFWRRQGYVAEGRVWLRRALGLAGSSSEGARAKALWGAGWLAFVQGDYTQGEAISSELLEVAAARVNPMDERNALTVLGMIMMARGNYAEALEPFERSLEICRALGSSWMLATSHLNLGMAKMHAGDLEGARERIARAHDLYVELGDEHFGARCVNYLGVVSLLGGNPHAARDAFLGSLNTFWDLQDTQGTAESLEGLAAAYAAAGEAEATRAAFLAGAADRLRERLTAKPYAFDEAALRPYIASAREALGGSEWRRSWEMGRSTSLKEAIDVAAEGSGRWGETDR